MSTPQSVTQADIERAIALEFYLTGAEAHQVAAARDGLAGFANQREQQELALLTICVLVLHNGSRVVGMSSCIDPAKFTAEVGRQMARADAIWNAKAMLGHPLNERLHGARLGRTTEFGS